MADEPDVRYESEFLQAGFTMIPNAVLYRTDLTIEARVVYGYLGHMAWRTAVDPSPPRSVIAGNLGLSEKAVTKALKELATVGEDGSLPLVEVARRGLGRTNVYVIRVPENGESRKEENGATRRAENAPTAGTLGHFPPFPQDSYKTRELATLAPSARNVASGGPESAQKGPPPIVKVAGRNLPLDAICKATGVDEDSPRVTQAVVALNGRTHKRTGKLLEPGIRHLFWIECVRYAERQENPGLLARAHDEPDEWVRALELRVQQKASRWREKYRDAALSPQALRNHWLDLVLDAGGATGAGLSAAEMERFE